MADSIKIDIQLADAAAQKSLNDFITKSKKVDDSFNKLKDSGQGTFNEISVGIGKSLGIYEIFAGSLAANVVTKSFEILKQGASELFNVFIVEGVKAAQESEEALNDLNRALAQTGLYSKTTSDSLVKFAKDMQKTTAFEDDLIIKNIALLQSMAQLDKEGLQNASKAAIQLSAALGKDLTSTTEAVAKAANGNFLSLKKMGVQFDDTGSQANSFKNVLKAVESQFGGSAESKLNTFSGAISQVKNNFGDLQEEFGNLIIKNPVVISAIGEISKIIKDLADNGFKKGSDGAKALGEGLLEVIKVTGMTIQFFNGLLTTVLTVFDGIIVAATSVLASFVGIVAPFSDTLQIIFENLEQQANESLDKIGERLVNGGPLNEIVKLVDSVGVAAQEGFSKIGTSADVSKAPIENLTKGIQKLTEEEKKQLEETNKYVDSLAKKNQSVEENQKIQLENLKLFYEQKDLVETDADAINYQAKIEREQQFYIQRQVILDQQFASEQARILSSTQSELSKTQALLTIQKKYELESNKSKTEYLKKKDELETTNDKNTVENRKSTFSTIATLSSSNNKLLAGIGKAAGIAQIAIDTPVAISKAMASAPPPFNFALAGLVGVAMAAQAAKIAGLNFEDGGIVPGTSFTGDRISANVNSGEMILNRRQQSQLFDMVSDRGSSSNNSSINANIGQLIKDIMSQPIIVNVDGKQLFNITRDQLASGRAF